MRAALHQRNACFETPVCDGLLSMRGVVDGVLNAPHAEEARSAVSKHAVRLSKLIGAATAIAIPSAAVAQDTPDLTKYDCTRLDDGKTVRGDELFKSGFRIASVGRFGQPNVMLVEPKSNARANCIMRPEGQK